jgi:5-oxoprolinase (ATP-hydrolysing)
MYANIYGYFYVHVRIYLQGPAGGVVGYGKTGYDYQSSNSNPNRQKKPIIGFDMGGTSTDVSRYEGKLEHVFLTSIAGVTIQAPQLDISTVAAGGGSRLFFRSGMFVVGPDSVGAHPGPVCYRKGGSLAITDANLLLGRIQAARFPKVYITYILFYIAYIYIYSFMYYLMLIRVVVKFIIQSQL